MDTLDLNICDALARLPGHATFAVSRESVEFVHKKQIATPSQL